MSLSEQSINALNEARLNARQTGNQAPVDFLVAEQSGSDILMRFADAENAQKIKIRDLHHLYAAILSAIRRFTGDNSYVVRFASQVINQNFPFIFSAEQRISVVDPLAIYHNPIGTLVKTGSLRLSVFNSEHYHAKTVNLVRSVTMQDRHGAWPKFVDRAPHDDLQPEMTSAAERFAVRRSRPQEEEQRERGWVDNPQDDGNDGNDGNDGSEQAYSEQVANG